MSSEKLVRTFLSKYKRFCAGNLFLGLVTALYHWSLFFSGGFDLNIKKNVKTIFKAIINKHISRHIKHHKYRFKKALLIRKADG